jgi:hypothetical protein
MDQPALAALVACCLFLALDPFITGTSDSAGCCTMDRPALAALLACCLFLALGPFITETMRLPLLLLLLL